MSGQKSDHTEIKILDINNESRWEPNCLFKIPSRFSIEHFDIIAQAANEAGVSDIDVQVGQPIWFDHYGWRRRASHRAINANEVDELIRVMYDRSGPALVNMQGRPIDVAYVVRPREGRDDRKLRLRINITGGRNPEAVGTLVSNGAQITMRVLPSTPRSLEDMGVPDVIVSQFVKRSGLILTTGPTGSGKSTLMAGGIRHMGESHHMSVKFIEYSAPIELVYEDLFFPHSFIHQVEVGRDIRIKADEGGVRMLWAACVANAMRRKPDTMVIGEARDGATIEGVVLAANTGHGVMSTMHTIGVAETVRRAIMAISPDQRAGVGVDLIDISNLYISQLLVPKIGGGRVPIREFMIFDDSARRRIIKSPMEQWTQVIQDMMIRGDVECQRMIDASKIAFENGLISEDTHLKLSMRQQQTTVQPIDRTQPAITESGGSQRFDADMDLAEDIEVTA